MTLRLVIFLTAILLQSCHPKTQKVEPPVEEMIEEDEFTQEKVTQQVRDVFLNDKEKGYVVDSFSLCDSAKTRSDEEMLSPFKKWMTYDTTFADFGDSAKVSFDFVADCCLDFLGSVNFHADTLALEYGYAYDMVAPCDCYCQYRMIYRFPRRKWKVLTIENIDGRKPYKK